MFVIKDDDVLLGCCGWDQDSVRHLYVDPDHTRKGIASRLLQHVENDFKTRTEASVIKAGIAVYAKEFYEANGYCLLSEECDWDGSRYYKMEKPFS